MNIKVCGITQLKQLQQLDGLNIEFAGLIFVKDYPRYVGDKLDKEAVKNADFDLKKVGVFKNPEMIDVLDAIDEYGLDIVQLHGEESVEFCRKLKELLPNLMTIKVLHASAGFQPEDATRYEADAIMLDAFHAELRGGTGQVFDWTLGRRTRELVPRLFLAGGLSPENVAEAIAEVQPYAVDACSSIELAPGLKDAGRMRAFVSAVRSI